MKFMSHSNDMSTNRKQVFLGGSCNPTTWRTEVAIPKLKSLGITYYNPQVSQWKPELIELEWNAKESAEVLFFVIDDQTRGIVSMIESAFILGSHRKLILVFKDLEGTGASVHGEVITERELKDLRQGQLYLQNILESQGIPIFGEIPEALECVARIIQGTKPQELSHKDCAAPVKSHIPLTDKLIRLREVFDSLDNEKRGEITLNDLRHAFRTLTDRELSNNHLHEIAIAQIGGSASLNGSDSELRTVISEDIRVNFDEFCCIVTEFKSQIVSNVSNHVSNKSTNEKLGQNIVNKLEVIFEPISRPFEWLLKPVNSAFKSSNSPQHIPYDALHSDIYLGGSTAQSCTWREDIAIPLLRKYGLTYFSSQSEGLRSEELIINETTDIEKSRILLFVITNKTRALSAMILAAYYVAVGRNVVLCIQYLNDECVIDGEKLTAEAIKDYNRGRAYLSDMAVRAGLNVFSDISEAVINCVRKCIFNNNVLNNQKNELTHNS